ncbi:hypothetical protein ABZ371_32715 [Streptomyces sp. NPDC005899]|uniref:hypothetical protein n=1 Tax=Streptomyces sp. NPDC005899 TaxID=3155716 RepID=UPI0033CC34B3
MRPDDREPTGPSAGGPGNDRPATSPAPAPGDVDAFPGKARGRSAATGTHRPPGLAKQAEKAEGKASQKKAAKASRLR